MTLLSLIQLSLAIRLARLSVRWIESACDRLEPPRSARARLSVLKINRDPSPARKAGFFLVCTVDHGQPAASTSEHFKTGPILVPYRVLRAERHGNRNLSYRPSCAKSGGKTKADR